MEHRRIILVGPTCAGKNYIRDKFEKKNYKVDVSYTSREPRPGEIDGKDYRFITRQNFQDRIRDHAFYEHVQYGDHYYGTGEWEWRQKR